MKKRRFVLRNRKVFFQGMAIFALSFLLGGTELFGGVRGFAPAFLCAAASCGAPVWPVAFGGVLGVLSAWGGISHLYLYVLPYAALCLVILYLRAKKRRPGRYALQLIFTVVHLIPAVCVDLPAYYRILYIIGVVIGVFSIGLFRTALVSATGWERAPLPSGVNAVCLVYLGGMAVARLGNVSIAGVGLGASLAVAACIGAAMLVGPVGGCCCGTLLGFIMSAQLDRAPFLCCVLAFSGAVAGALAKEKKFLSAFVFAVAYALVTLLFEGYITPTLAIAELGVGVLLFAVVPKEKMLRLREFFARKKADESADLVRRSQRAVNRRLQEMSAIFRQMAALLNEEETVPETDVNDCVRALGAKVCADCVRRPRCSLGSELRRIGQAVAAGRTPQMEETEKKCIRPEALRAAAIVVRDEVNRELFAGKMLDSERDMVGRELRAISALVSAMAEKTVGTEISDEPLARELRIELESMGIGCLDVTAGKSDGRPCCCISRLPTADEPACERLIGRAVNEVFGRDMELSRRRSVVEPGGVRTMYYGGTPAFSVNGGAAGRTKSDSPVSGDYYAMTSIDDARTLLVLSDGMGSGRRAHEESAAAVELIEGLFCAGFPRELIIDTVNRLLLLRSSDESYATLDLCLIDRVRGEAEFIKTGASGGYIKRGGRLISVTPAALPLGVVENVEPYTARLKLEAGDIIILMSDGVTESTEADISAWLAANRSVNPHVIAESLVNYCLTKTEGVCRDDMTVLAARIDVTAAGRKRVS